MTNVLVINSFHPQGLDRLRAHPDVKLTVVDDDSDEALAPLLPEAEIITVRTAKLPRKRLEQAPRLKMVVKHGVGVDSIDVEWLTARGIPVAIAPTGNAQSVAEHTMALLLGLAKNLLTNDAATREGRYAIRNTVNTCCISEKNVLICGFGRIGRRVARMCSGFDMRVSVFDPMLSQADLPAVMTLVPDLAAGLPHMDVVCLHMPLTPQSRNLFNLDMLRRMKPEAFLINCSRGGVVPEADLYTALSTGLLAGAGLDVFEDEPPTADNRLFTLPNVLVSPHNAAMSREGAIRMAVETAANVVNFVEGKLGPDVVFNREVMPLR